MSGSFLIIAAAFTGAFWAGFLLVLAPSKLLPRGQSDWSVDGARAFLTVSLAIVAGVLIDLIGAQTIALLGASLAAGGFLLLDRAMTRGVAFGATTLLAGGAATLLTASVVMMPLAIFPDYVARSVNIGFLAILFGSLAGKPLLGLLVGRLDIRRTLLVLSLASVVPAALVALTPAADFESSLEVNESTSGEIDARLALLAAAALLCFPLEKILSPWAWRYPFEINLNAGVATLTGGGFWLCFVLSRLAAGLGLTPGSEAVWLFVLGALIAIVSGNVLGAYGRKLTMLGVLLLGACCGPLVPTTLGLTLGSFGDYPGFAVGVVTAAGLAGLYMIGPVFDVSAMQRESKTALRGSAMIGILLLIPALVLAIVG